MTIRWQAPKRSEQAQAIYQAAQADQQKNPDRYRLDPDLILSRVLQEHPIEQLGANDWQPGFSHFLASAEQDAQLNAVGCRMAAGAAAGRLQARLKIAQWLQDHPDHAKQPSRPPIFIVGGWRTGSTLLQRLLAQIPNLRALYPWELSAPWRAAEVDEQGMQRLAAGAQKAHDYLHMLNPKMQQVHDSGAWLPEECVLALGTGMRNWGFLSTMGLSSYADWLAGEDFCAEYTTYAQVLAMLEQRQPEHHPNQRFVLKAPAHTAELDALLKVFPEATIIHLHRDVVETVASGASLFAVFRATYSDDVDGFAVGEFQARQTQMWFERALQFRKQCMQTGVGNFVDVYYEDLIADPLAVVRTILAAAKEQSVEGLWQDLKQYLDSNTQHQHGKHTYSSEEFGLDEKDIRERFAPYRDYFGVS